MSILLENAITLLSQRPYRFERRNILIEGSKISKVSKSKIICKGAQKLDCTNKVAIPGLINAHTHTPMSLLRGLGDDLSLNDWLNKFTWPREALMTPKDMEIGSMLAIAEMIHCGVSCFNDNYFHMDSIAKAVLDSSMRACLGYSMIDRTKYTDNLNFDSTKADSELKIAKEFAKKYSNNDTITVSMSPHSAHTCSAYLLTESAKLAKEFDCILHIHSAETKEELQICKKAHGSSSAISSLDKYGCLGKKTVLAHGIYVSNDDIKLISKNGASVCTCPVSNLKLASGNLPPIKDYLQNKVNLSIGTDGSASNNTLSIFESMKVGLLCQKNANFNPAHLSADDYLYMGTQGGANALHINCGVIQPNTFADIALINIQSANLVPFQNNSGWLLYSAGSQNVSDLIVNGKWVMKNHVISTFREADVLKRAQKVVDGLN